MIPNRGLVGDKVVLNVPENPFVNGRRGVIKEVKDWGVFVATDAAATGEFRALWAEILYDDQSSVETVVEERVVLTEPYTTANGYSNGTVPKSSPSPAYLSREAREEGYTGNACDICGSFKTRRTGNCWTCEDCGSTGGCS